MGMNIPKLSLELLHATNIEIAERFKDDGIGLVAWMNEIKTHDLDLAIYLGINTITSENFSMLKGFMLAYIAINQALETQRSAPAVSDLESLYKLEDDRS